MDLSPYRIFIEELAAASGEFIRPHFGQANLAVEHKADASPVTVADREAERLMRDMILRRFPSHGLIGEEWGEERSDAEWVWVLDPIDGTKAFITGTPLWGTLIALLHQGQPVLGAIHQPILGQLCIGDGAVTTLNGHEVRVRDRASLSEATLLTSDWLSPGTYQSGRGFDEVARRVKLVRTWGDCYGYLLVATGWADIMCDPVMNPWDIAALVPIIRGAGGVITNWQGDAPYPANSIVAAAPTLHAEVIRLLNP